MSNTSNECWQSDRNLPNFSNFFFLLFSDGLKLTTKTVRNCVICLCWRWHDITKNSYISYRQTAMKTIQYIQIERCWWRHKPPSTKFSDVQPITTISTVWYAKPYTLRIIPPKRNSKHQQQKAINWIQHRKAKKHLITKNKTISIYETTDNS